ncbi:hypothetical protein FA10DRAFT_302374 [Acaromyces ingoldii]|uniref:Uncharacterized protein n=1 Tax=Acaromyces ingoldii TaxID=215250 RepID=A0A316YML5_9BASI|nr:hypothetical protein FA10DRAFT_302374 [Acaromyces ingoldii]PWN88985.1 hypothetical protein FA10DRAFT_302374 [Acaromyces ingoldii]
MANNQAFYVKTQDKETVVSTSGASHIQHSRQTPLGLDQNCVTLTKTRTFLSAPTPHSGQQSQDPSHPAIDDGSVLLWSVEHYNSINTDKSLKDLGLVPPEDRLISSDILFSSEAITGAARSPQMLCYQAPSGYMTDPSSLDANHAHLLLQLISRFPEEPYVEILCKDDSVHFSIADDFDPALIRTVDWEVLTGDNGEQRGLLLFQPAGIDIPASSWVVSLQAIPLTQALDVDFYNRILARLVTDHHFRYRVAEGQIEPSFGPTFSHLQEVWIKTRRASQRV